MKKYIDIPIKIKTGKKYKTEMGFSAIKDGITSKKVNSFQKKKPSWLKVEKISKSKEFFKVKDITNKYNLETVCEEAKCPNINECWSHGTATIMLMGKVCTRACKFCSVDTGNPNGWLDNNEPFNAARSIKLMNLNYVVITSVDRDDLNDCGAGHYAKTIFEIKKISPHTKVEALIPDFQGIRSNIDKLLSTEVDVIAQNIETVDRLTHVVRDPRAGYRKTINVLKYVKETSPKIFTKSSMMLGLGEKDDEIFKSMDDLRSVGVDILTMGQYMQPTKHHIPVHRFVPPQDFEMYRSVALSKGFFEVASGPMVRSSYRADRVFSKIK